MQSWVKSGLLLLCGVTLGAGAIGVVWKRSNRPPTKNYALRDDILVRGNTDLREVAFTFDDGPRPEVARDLLNTLGKEGVRATFFVVGKQVDLYPAIVRRMMNEGHEVANHTYNHPRLDDLDAKRIRSEIASCDKAIFRATGAHAALFRPPGMRYDDVVIDTAQDLGYVTIHWNVGAKDFTGAPEGSVAERVLKNVTPGSVILLHGQPETVAALPEIVSSLRARGYRFVTVSQMLARLPRPVIVKTNAYAAIEPKPVSKPVAIARETSAAPRARHRAGAVVATKPSAPVAAKSAVRGVDVPAYN